MGDAAPPGRTEDPAEDRPQPDFASRGGLKLRHALDVFALHPAHWVCADLGCSKGGFTDCLLRAGAARVIAVDTAYGQLAYALRTDPRVEVRERTNALHAEPPEGGVDLVVIDLGWTRQRHAMPAALRWLRPGGRVISLIKPHYEASKVELARLGRGGVLPEDHALRVVEEVVAALPEWGAEVLGVTRSPVLGGARRGGGAGNAEWLALARRLGDVGAIGAR